MPFAVFHERQALADPLMAGFAALSVLLMVRLARRFAGARPAAVAGTARRICQAQRPAVPAAGLIALLLREAGLTSARWGVSAAVSRDAWRGRWFTRRSRRRITPFAGNAVTVQSIRLLHLGDAETQAAIMRDAAATGLAFWQYAGPVILALVLLSVLWIVQGKYRRALLFLLIPAVGFAAIPMLTDRTAWVIPGRYLMPFAAPLAVTAGLSLSVLLRELQRRAAPAGMWALVAALVLFLLPSSLFNVQIMGDPENAPLTAVDDDLYVYGLTAGHAYKALAADLLETWQAEGRPLHTLTHGGFAWETGVHMGPRVGQQLRFDANSPGVQASVVEWLARDELIYVIADARTAPLPEHPMGLHLERVGRYQHYNVDLTLFRVTGIEGTLAQDVFDQRVPEPEKFDAAYDELASQLQPVADTRTIVVFPARHAEALTERGISNVIPLAAQGWPLSLTAAQSALDDLALGEDGEFVEVIQVDPTHLNPERTFSGALTRTLYRTGDAAYDVIAYHMSRDPRRRRWQTSACSGKTRSTCPARLSSARPCSRAARC
jgi:hypothetical protein